MYQDSGEGAAGDLPAALNRSEGRRRLLWYFSRRVVAIDKCGVLIYWRLLWYFSRDKFAIDKR